MKTTIINCDCCGKKIPEAGVVVAEQYVRFIARVGGVNQVYGKWYKSSNVCDPELSELCMDCYNKLLQELETMKSVYKKYRNEHKEEN